MPRGQSWRGPPARYACCAAGLPAAGLGKSRVVQAPSSAPLVGVRCEREPGENPGLSRSGMQERPPSSALVRRQAGKRRPLGAPSSSARLRVRRPASCAGRAASGGSSPRGMGGWPQPLRLVPWPRSVRRLRGDDHPVDVKDVVMTAVAPFTATILGSPRIGPNRELKRAVEGYWAGRIDRADSNRSPPRCAATPGSALAARRPRLRAGEHLLLLRPGARHRRLLGALPARVADIADDLDRYFAAARGNDDVAAARDDQVVRHQLPLPRARDRHRDAFSLNPAKVLGELKEARAKGFRRARWSSGRSPSWC